MNDVIYIPLRKFALNIVPTLSAISRLSLVPFGFLVFFFIILLKARTSAEFYREPFLLFYTVFITSFEISRLMGAILYKKVFRQVFSKKNEYFEPKVSFIIPCKNEEKAIAMTIDKCFDAQYPSSKLEVIVINDGSTDNTREVLVNCQKRHPELKIIDWKINKGKRHGMAAGIKKAKGEIIVQLDSDSYIDPKTFKYIIEPFKNEQIGAVCAHSEPENSEENLLTKMQAAYYFMSFRILKAAESTFFSVFCCSGCSSAYRKEAIFPILDEWLEEKFLGLPVTWGDDRALTNWVLKRGYKTIYTSQAKAYTICPNNWQTFFKQQVRWKKGWFVNSIFACKFILKREPFVAFTYFFPLIFVTLVTPFMAVKALIYNPFFRGITPVYYVLGVFSIATLITVYYRLVNPKNKYWPYMFVWSTVNMFFLSFVLFYAIFRLKDRGWSTR